MLKATSDFRLYWLILLIFDFISSIFSDSADGLPFVQRFTVKMGLIYYYILGESIKYLILKGYKRSGSISFLLAMQIHKITTVN